MGPSSALIIRLRLDQTYSTGPAGSRYSEVTPFSDLFQQEPHEGSPATEKTEAWIFFDDRNIYISARCSDSHPEREIANEMRRDSNNVIQNESFTVIFDSFHDKRNGVFFQTNALGALRDAMSTDDAVCVEQPDVQHQYATALGVRTVE